MHDYLKFWRAEAPIFTRQVAASDAFLSVEWTSHLERARLFAGQDQAILSVIGQPGSGKSTFLRRLAADLDMSSHETLLLTLVKDEAAPAG